eukprot:6487274-Amphidinium_carterae.1
MTPTSGSPKGDLVRCAPLIGEQSQRPQASKGSVDIGPVPQPQAVQPVSEAIEGSLGEWTWVIP